MSVGTLSWMKPWGTTPSLLFSSGLTLIPSPRKEGKPRNQNLGSFLDFGFGDLGEVKLAVGRTETRRHNFLFPGTTQNGDREAFSSRSVIRLLGILVETTYRSRCSLELDAPEDTHILYRATEG
ncbi:hypothetical protein BJ170DRAFT_597071 [Xylariales sp. AK1849]|nr:hypothetical protein BJ170DRAFT_597071 [Xylariales sp. AK1849]